MPSSFNPRALALLEQTDPEAFAQFMTLLSAEALDAERELYEGSLLEFFKRAWKEMEPGPLSISWFHEEICAALEAITFGEIRDLIVNVPPRHSKSSLISIVWPAWCWTRSETLPLSGPHTTFLCVSYGATLAEIIALKMLRLVSGHWYQSLWGDRVKMLPDQSSRAHFANAAGGERISASVEAGLIGRGASIQILDDVHNLEGAESDTQRETTLRAISEGLPTRITDPRISARVLVMQRLHSCLLPGTKIRTPNGEENIESIKIGDKVFGSDGWQCVQIVSSRSYNGEAYGVRLYGHPTICWTTNNHLFETKRGWIRAEELRRDDWIAFRACPKRYEKIPWESPLRAPPPRLPSGNFNGDRKSRISKIKLQELVEEGKSNVAIAHELGVHRNTIQCYMWSYQLSRIIDRNPIFSDNHLRDPKFWLIVGYWIAEGSFISGRNSQRCGIRFSFGPTEIAYALEVKELLDTYGAFCRITRSQTASTVEANCSQLARWCNKHFGNGALYKTLPEFVFSLPKECQERLLEGWLRGDGCSRRDKRRAGSLDERSGSSVSQALLHGFHRLAWDLGHRAYLVGGSGKPVVITIRGRSAISSGKGGEVRIARPAKLPGRQKFVLCDNIVWHRIKTIETKEYYGDVYDITTPSHDFVVGNATVHNSDATSWCLENWRRDLVHLMYPARFDPDRACPTDHRTKAGELLWPEMWTEEALDQATREMSEYAKAGQFQQSPVPRGGGIIKREWWKPWPDLDPQGNVIAGTIINGRIQFPAFEYIVAWVDTAFTDKVVNDPCAMVVFGIFRAEGKGRIERRSDGTYERVADDHGYPKAMLIYGWEKHLTLHGPPEEIPFGVSQRDWHGPRYREERQKNWGLVEWVVDTCKRYKVDHLGIETQAAGLLLENELRTLHSEGDWGVETVPAKGSKLARLEAVSHLWSNGQIYAPTYDDGTNPSWCTPILDQVSLYPRSKRDDLVDVCSGALAHLRGIGLFERKEEFDIGEEEIMQYDRHRQAELPYGL